MPDKLLIVSEQGLGDTLQFMRFLPLLRKKDQKVYFCAQEKLHGVIKNSKIDLDPLSPNKANKFSEGKWIPLLSLPKILNISPNNFMKSWIICIMFNSRIKWGYTITITKRIGTIFSLLRT